MITHHTQLLNALIEKYGYKSYLEIGVQNPANNFDKLKCEWKVGVDPDMVCKPKTGVAFNGTSDEYFEERPSESSLFDLGFIDGNHTKEQVKKDFENLLRCLSPNGRIVIHDVLPENEAGTLVPRQTKQWWGDVYKWAMVLRNYSGIRFVTYNIDNGCMVVWKDKTAEPYVEYVGPCDWNTYKSMGCVLLNVTDEVII